MKVSSIGTPLARPVALSRATTSSPFGSLVDLEDLERLVVELLVEVLQPLPHRVEAPAHAALDRVLGVHAARCRARSSAIAVSMSPAAKAA